MDQKKRFLFDSNENIIGKCIQSAFRLLVTKYLTNSLNATSKSITVQVIKQKISMQQMTGRIFLLISY